MNEKLKMTRKKIEEVEEANRELRTTYEQMSQNIAAEENKEKEYDIKISELYYSFKIHLKFCFIIRKTHLDEKNKDLKQVEAQIKEFEGNLQGYEAKLSRNKYISQIEEFQDHRKDQNDLLNSYIKSIVSDGQGSLSFINSVVRLSMIEKNVEVTKEKVCICAIF